MQTRVNSESSFSLSDNFSNVSKMPEEQKKESILVSLGIFSVIPNSSQLVEADVSVSARNQIIINTRRNLLVTLMLMERLEGEDFSNSIEEINKILDQAFNDMISLYHGCEKNENNNPQVQGMVF